MSQNTGQGLGIYTAGQGVGGESVPQIVEAHGWKFGSSQQNLQVVIGSGWGHGQFGHRGIMENPIAVGVFFSLLQKRCCAGWEQDGSGTGFCLGFSYPDTTALASADRAVNMEPACTLFKVLSFETADFSQAHACGQFGVEEIVPLSILLQSFQKSVQLAL